MSQSYSANDGDESDYSRQTVPRRGMRTGYTTGSCAAAAAKAATLALLTGAAVDQANIHLPVGRDASFPIHRCEWTPDGKGVLCSVIKDGGDDPDVTHGAEICVTVSRAAESGQHSGQQVVITGGPGVGMVTRPGTGIAVGEPAVTRVPRRMIIESVGTGCQQLRRRGGRMFYRADSCAQRGRDRAQDHECTLGRNWRDLHSWQYRRGPALLYGGLARQRTSGHRRGVGQ